MTLEAAHRRAAQQILAFRRAILLAFPGEDLTTFDDLAALERLARG